MVRASREHRAALGRNQKTKSDSPQRRDTPLRSSGHQEDAEILIGLTGKEQVCWKAGQPGRGFFCRTGPPTGSGEAVTPPNGPKWYDLARFSDFLMHHREHRAAFGRNQKTKSDSPQRHRERGEKLCQPRMEERSGAGGHV